MVCAAFFFDPRKPDVKRFLVFNDLPSFEAGCIPEKLQGAQKSPAKNHRFHVSELLVVKQLKIRIMALKVFMVSFYKGVFPKMGIPKTDGL